MYDEKKRELEVHDRTVSLRRSKNRIAIRRPRRQSEAIAAQIAEKHQRRADLIIGTHNPNLAVVCDADQLIHCSMEKRAKNKVTYTAGSLENPEINKLTIDVLEGTRPAFDHRDPKYQLRN